MRKWYGAFSAKLIFLGRASEQDFVNPFDSFLLRERGCSECGVEVWKDLAQRIMRPLYRQPTHHLNAIVSYPRLPQPDHAASQVMREK